MPVTNIEPRLATSTSFYVRTVGCEAFAIRPAKRLRDSTELLVYEDRLMCPHPILIYTGADPTNQYIGHCLATGHLLPACPICLGMGKAVRARKYQESCLLIVETEAAAGCEESSGCGVHLHGLGMGLLNRLQVYILVRLQIVGKPPPSRYYRPVRDIHEHPLRYIFTGNADAMFYA